MNDQELKELWRAQIPTAAPAVDQRAQIEAMREKMSKFRRGLNAAYAMEVGLRALIMVIFLFYFFIIPHPITRIGALIVVAGELFVTLRLFQTRKRALTPDLGAPVAAWLRQEQDWLREWAHDVKPFRRAFWEDLVPLWPGVNVFMWGFPHVSVWGKIAFTIFYTLILASSYWLNRARPKKAFPLESELQALLENEPARGQTEEPATAEAPRARNRSTVWMALAFLIGLAAIGAGFWKSLDFRRAPTEPRAPVFEGVSALDGEDVAKVDAWLEEQVALAKYPGLSVAIVRDGKMGYSRAIGFANLETGEAATPQTPYNVASVTKAFTASVAVMLDARGVIDLDDPVAKYLPKDVAISDNPKVGATITLRQLASHTSGLPRGVPGPVQTVEGRYELEPRLLYEHLAKVSLEYAPGADEVYSNLGFGLLGHALERAAGKSLNALIQEMVGEPLALQGTAIQVDEKLRVATGYSSSIPRRARTHSFRERLAASGGLVTTVEDLARFLAAQMKPGLFTAETLKELHTATRLSDGSAARTALGWTIRPSEVAGRIVEKNGGRNNCSAWMGFSPEHRVGVAVITNCGEPGVEPIGRWLLERCVSGGAEVKRK